ncbi:MAG: YifB family Mg chelatase-like AAA ATPase [Planktomarina sp.]
MTAITYTTAFEGIDAHLVEVQCALSPGLPAFQIVGLPNKAVSEARERVRAALAACSVALPSKRITVNLSPADMPKDGSHFDLPIAVALLAALGLIPPEKAEEQVVMGELSLNGNLVPVTGCLPAAMAAHSEGKGLICPEACGAEAAWVADAQVVAPSTLAATLRHMSGQAVLPQAKAGDVQPHQSTKDMREVKGQERAKRAMEIAAAGRHHLLMIGTPGSGKSMLSARMPGILPPLSPAEALETSMIHSLSGLLDDGGISRDRPFREPHHTSSMAAIVGGGRNAKPGEISLAHNGVLFLDEFPEFTRQVLETLRQPIETGEVVVARANAHVKYPCRFMLVAAANPCRCGYLSDPGRACARAPECGADYLSRISGPLMDRFDLRVDVPPVRYTDLDLPADGDTSAVIAARVKAARDIQMERYHTADNVWSNADAEGDVLEAACILDEDGRAFLMQVAARFGLSARGYHRVLKVGRTISDLENTPKIERHHLAEAISFRMPEAATDQGRIKRNTVDAPQPAKMAMASESRP